MIVHCDADLCFYWYEGECLHTNSNNIPSITLETTLFGVECADYEEDQDREE